jgi:hypothetical protein
MPMIIARPSAPVLFVIFGAIYVVDHHMLSHTQVLIDLEEAL